MRKKLLLSATIVIVIMISALSGLSSYKFKTANQPALKSGDIIFIINQGGQGKAIQLATGSKFTHVGVVFIENGTTYVYHAVEPVSKSTLSDFIAMSEDGKYSVKRLKNESLLTDKSLDKMRSEAIQKLGVHYDLGFNWSDEELYCSEYVWKLYHHALNLEVGKLRPLKEFNLSHPKVKHIMKQRYGNNIPYNEKMISPGDMFNSPLLIDITPQ